MNKRNSYRGFGIYLILILVVVAVWYWMDGNTASNTYTRALFESALAEEKVAQVRIVPNRETPTGNIYIVFREGENQTLTVSDVNEIEQYMREKGFLNYTVENPPTESWLLTLLPYLIIFGAMFIFFMIMTNQATASSGGGSRMMNFGKSRARLMTEDMTRHVTFASVAGLKEEKEELGEIVDFLRAPKSIRSSVPEFQRACFWWGLREPEKHFSQRRSPGRRACRFSAFPVRTLWKCLLV